MKPAAKAVCFTDVSALPEKFAGPFEAVSKEIQSERRAMLFLEDPTEMGTAHVTGHRQVIQAEVFGEALFETDERRGVRDTVWSGPPAPAPSGWNGNALAGRSPGNCA